MSILLFIPHDQNRVGWAFNEIHSKQVLKAENIQISDIYILVIIISLIVKFLLKEFFSTPCISLNVQNWSHNPTKKTTTFLPWYEMNQRILEILKILTGQRKNCCRRAYKLRHTINNKSCVLEDFSLARMFLENRLTTYKRHKNNINVKFC